MRKRRPTAITLIALLQFVPIVILPPEAIRAIDWRVLLVPIALFGVVGWALFALQPMARTLTIFVQGLNILVRLLITLSKVVPSKAVGTPANVPLLATTVVSIVLSTFILFYVDQPETQLLFES